MRRRLLFIVVLIVVLLVILMNSRSEYVIRYSYPQGDPEPSFVEKADGLKGADSLGKKDLFRISALYK